MCAKATHKPQLPNRKSLAFFSSGRQDRRCKTAIRRLRPVSGPPSFGEAGFLFQGLGFLGSPLLTWPDHASRTPWLQHLASRSRRSRIVPRALPSGMPFNRSHDRERREVLPSPLSNWAGHVLTVDCGTQSCGGPRALEVDALIHLHGDRPVVALLGCLWCPSCSNRAVAAELRRPAVPGARTPADLRLALIGPGARCR